MQVHPIPARVENLFRSCTIGMLLQFRTGRHSISSRAAHHPVLFFSSRARLFWDDVPPMDRLISAARSCAFMWVPVLNGPGGQVKLSKLTASPRATNGHPRIPLILVGAMPVIHLPLAGCSQTSWSSEPFQACRPTFPFIQLLPVLCDPSPSGSLPQVP